MHREALISASCKSKAIIGRQTLNKICGEKLLPLKDKQPLMANYGEKKSCFDINADVPLCLTELQLLEGPTTEIW